VDSRRGVLPALAPLRPPTEAQCRALVAHGCALAAARRLDVVAAYVRTLRRATRAVEAAGDLRAARPRGPGAGDADDETEVEVRLAPPFIAPPFASVVDCVCESSLCGPWCVG
jgi:hypothetical protein